MRAHDQHDAKEADALLADVPLLAGATPISSGSIGEVPSYERALPYLSQLNADVITFEGVSDGGKDLPLFGKHKTDKKTNTRPTRRSASASSTIATPSSSRPSMSLA
jgi:hypothetical protein